jgi:hypothetical protein
MVLPALPAMVGIKAFLGSKKFLIPVAIITLLLAIGGGTYFYLNHQQKEAVTAAVEAADSNATIQTYETKEIINTRTIEVDRRFEELQRQTIEDYNNVRNQINNAPPADLASPAPPLLIDTLNELDRLRQQRRTGGVPDADVPVG